MWVKNSYHENVQKNYIGKGTKLENLAIVKVSLKVENILKHKHECEGNEYLTFEVAKMQQPDQFGRTHIAYVSTLQETEDEKPKKKSFKK